MAKQVNTNDSKECVIERARESAALIFKKEI